MKKLVGISLVLLFVTGICYGQEAIECYSETGKFIGHTYLVANQETIYVYDERGYYIGYITMAEMPFLYYDALATLKAKVYINSSEKKAVFFFLEQTKE